MKTLFHILFKKIPVCILVLSGCALGCKKLVEVPPPVTELTNSNVYTADATAAAVLTGLYTYMNQGPTGGKSFTTGINSISVQSGLSADELTLFAGETNPLYKSQYLNLLNSSTNLPQFWTSGFYYINICNSAMEGLSGSASLTPAIKQQLLGEAKFMRAFFNFYLVNLYGDVPLVLTSNYQQNSLLPRTPQKQVYQQIISDLKDAQAGLSDTYLDATLLNTTPERYRPTKWAATALLARAYLYSGDYNDAALQSSAVINNNSLFSLSALSTAFLDAVQGNNEAIWQLQPVNQGWNTEDAKVFILTAAPSNARPVYLSNFLLNAFEPGDQRLTNWTGSITTGGVTYHFPFKYKSATLNAPVTESLMVFRLAEQYLIRAEAEANGATGGTSAAINDLNVIRNRAGLPNYTGLSDQPSVLTAIYHERQVELFTEWGNRWLDLKRANTANAVMSVVTPQKGGTWNADWQLYPIPLNDIQFDPSMAQNPGY